MTITEVLAKYDQGSAKWLLHMPYIWHMWLGSTGVHFWQITDEMTKNSRCDKLMIFATLWSLFTSRAHNDELDDALDTENVQLTSNI